MTVLKRPTTLLLRNKPTVFELSLRNDGFFETAMTLSVDDGENQGGLIISINGQSLAGNIEYTGFKPEARYTTVVFQRGLRDCKYQAITLWFSVL